MEWASETEMKWEKINHHHLGSHNYSECTPPTGHTHTHPSHHIQRQTLEVELAVLVRVKLGKALKGRLDVIKTQANLRRHNQQQGE